MAAAPTAAPTAAPNAAPTASDLDDELLGRVFYEVPKGEGASITLVCKRWRAVFYAQPALWRRFTLQPSLHAKSPAQREQCLAAQHRLLQRVAPLVRCLEVPCYGHIEYHGPSTASRWQGLHFLRLLKPGVAQEVALLNLPADAGSLATVSAALEQLGQLTGLTRLELSQAMPAGTGLPPAATLAALRCLAPTLRCLRLNGAADYPLPHGMLGVVLSMSQLSELKLSARGLFSWDGVALRQLSTLRQLSVLELYSSGDALNEDAMAVEEQQASEQPGSQQLELPLPAHFPGSSLRSLQLTRYVEGLKLPGGKVSQLAYALSTPCLAGTPAGGQQQPLAGTSGQPPAASVVLQHAEPTSLQQLLGSMCPPGVDLQHLELESFNLDLPALQNCSRLATLRSLDFKLYGTADMDAPLAALLQQAPQLEALGLKLGGRDALPPSLLARAGLRRLTLQHNGLRDLPEGVYLSDLEELDCSDNAFRSLPRALVAATALRRLAISNRLEPYCPHNDELNLELTAADVDEVLTQLPALRQLDLGMSRLPAPVAAHLAAAAPQLEVVHKQLPRDYQQDVVIQERIREEEQRMRCYDRRARLAGDDWYDYTEEDALSDIIHDRGRSPDPYGSDGMSDDDNDYASWG